MSIVQFMSQSPRRLAPELLGPHAPGTSRSVVRLEREHGEAQLSIEGALDALTVGEIKPAIDAVVADQPSRVTVDLERVPIMDSMGVSAIVSLWKRITAQGGSVRVVRAHDQPLAVLKVLRLDGVLCAA